MLHYREGKEGLYPLVHENQIFQVAWQITEHMPSLRSWSQVSKRSLLQKAWTPTSLCGSAIVFIRLSRLVNMASISPRQDSNPSRSRISLVLEYGLIESHHIYRSGETLEMAAVTAGSAVDSAANSLHVFGG